MENSERDEQIVEARISGTSTRALAKRYQTTSREIESVIDRQLDFDLDARQKLRLIKLSVGRIEALLALFFERATKDKDVQAGTLCVKLEERLSILLGLDVPLQSRVDVYQVEQAKAPDDHEKIRDALFRVKYGPNWKPGNSFDSNGKLLTHEHDAGDDPDRESVATGTDRERSTDAT